MIPLPNYTQTPNAFFDEIMRDLNESELKVFLAITRKTFGWKKSRDRISLSQIVEMTGLSKPSVLSGIKGLVNKDLILFFQSQSGNEFEVKVGEPELVKQVDQASKATLPELVKQVDTQKKPSKETIQKKESKHQHGEFNNVLLTSSELEKLKTSFPLDWQERIKTMDEGIELKGYKYKSHYLAILKWSEREKVAGPFQKNTSKKMKFGFDTYNPNREMPDEIRM